MGGKRKLLEIPEGMGGAHFDPKSFVTAFVNAARQEKATSQYAATYAEYCALMAKINYTQGPTAISLAVYLIVKAKALNSARSLDGYQSHIVMTAARHGLYPDLTSYDRLFLRQVKRACGATFKGQPKRSNAWGRTELDTIQLKLTPAPAKDLHEFATYAHMCVHHSALARPGDLCGDNVVARAGHVTFLPKTDRLPQGGAHILLTEDKGSRQMGTSDSSLLQICGTGGPTCPVVLLRQMFDIYSLDANPGEPIFAAMRPDGRRVGPPGATSGAAVISNKEYNASIAGLFKRAGLPRFTARGARRSRKIELSCAGVADPVVTTLGRWHSYQASRPYDAQSIALLEHVARVLGVSPDAIMAPAPQPPAPQPPAPVSMAEPERPAARRRKAPQPQPPAEHAPAAEPGRPAKRSRKVIP